MRSETRYKTPVKPAQTIIQKLGGPNAVAKVAGVHRTRVFAWQRSRAAGGTDGRIPQDHIPKLLAFARKKGIELSADEFLPLSAQRELEAAE